TLNADRDAAGVGVFTQAAGSTVDSGGGPVTVQATDVVLGGALSAGGGVATIQNSTNLRPIDLGTNTPGTLGLTDTELDNVTAGAIRVGSLSAGAINVSAAITPAGTTFLSLINNAGVSETGSITVANLRVSSGGAVNLGGANQVGTLAGSATGLFASNSPITLTADALDVQQQVNAGVGGVVTVQPFTTALPVTVGAGATGLGVSDTELALVTAGVVR